MGPPMRDDAGKAGCARDSFGRALRANAVIVLGAFSRLGAQHLLLLCAPSSGGARTGSRSGLTAPTCRRVTHVGRQPIARCLCVAPPLPLQGLAGSTHSATHCRPMSCPLSQNFWPCVLAGGCHTDDWRNHWHASLQPWQSGASEQAPALSVTSALWAEGCGGAWRGGCTNASARAG